MPRSPRLRPGSAPSSPADSCAPSERAARRSGAPSPAAACTRSTAASTPSCNDRPCRRWRSSRRRFSRAAPRALLSHGSAAALWGLCPPEPGPVTVTVVAGEAGRTRPGITVHRVGTLDRRDVRRRRSLLVTSPARTLLDRATVLSDRQLERELDEALVRRLTSRTAIGELLERCPRRPGTRRLHELIDPERYTTFTRAESEERMLALLRRGGLPMPESNVRMESIEVDFLWRDERVIVEVDGWASHGTHAAFERDRRRDARLENDGWRVIALHLATADGRAGGGSRRDRYRISLTPVSPVTVGGRELETVEIPGEPGRRPLVLLHEGLGSVGSVAGLPAAAQRGHRAAGDRILALRPRPLAGARGRRARGSSSTRRRSTSCPRCSPGQTPPSRSSSATATAARSRSSTPGTVLSPGWSPSPPTSSSRTCRCRRSPRHGGPSPRTGCASAWRATTTIPTPPFAAGATSGSIPGSPPGTLAPTPPASPPPRSSSRAATTPTARSRRWTGSPAASGGPATTLVLPGGHSPHLEHPDEVDRGDHSVRGASGVAAGVAAGDRAISSRRAKRWTFPVSVRGSSSTKRTTCGILVAAQALLAEVAQLVGQPRRRRRPRRARRTRRSGWPARSSRPRRRPPAPADAPSAHAPCRPATPTVRPP